MPFDRLMGIALRCFYTMHTYSIFGQYLQSPIKLLAPEVSQNLEAHGAGTVDISPHECERKAKTIREAVRVYPRRNSIIATDFLGFKTYYCNRTIYCCLKHLVNPHAQFNLFKNIASNIASLDSGWILHASAFAFDNHAVLLLGEKGAGKSTLAAYAEALGATHLADDIALIRRQNEQLRLIPANVGKVLFDDSISLIEDSLAVNISDLALDIGRKKWIPMNTSLASQIPPISEIYFLSNQDRQNNDKEAALKMLITGTICVGNFRRNYASHYLPFYSELLTQTPWQFHNRSSCTERITELAQEMRP